MKKLDLKNLGKRLRDARLAKGATQEEIANVVKSTKQLVSHWETGRCEITLGRIIVLARHYGMSVDALIGHNKRT